MLFGKKKEIKANSEDLLELPELPELPRLPNISSISDMRTDSSFREIPEVSSQNIPQVEERETRKMTREISSSLPMLPSTKPEKFNQEIIKTAFAPQYTREIDSFGQKEGLRVYDAEPMKSSQSEKGQDKPVFIRIDKFQNAITTISEIYQQLQEIENNLGEIKTLKSREEQELAGWEEEIQGIKSKLEGIDKNILNKLD